jgi:hypothetical protein
VRANTSPRHASSGIAGSCPASISKRASANTGAFPDAVSPAAVQVSPVNSARIGACVVCDLELAIGLRSTIEDTLPRALTPLPGVEGAAFEKVTAHSAVAFVAVAVRRFFRGRLSVKGGSEVLLQLHSASHCWTSLTA